MKQKRLLLLVAMTVMALAANGADVVTRRLAGLTDFHAIENSANAEIHYTQGNAYEVTVTADADAMEAVNIEVSDGTLVIEKKATAKTAGRSYDDANLVFHITAPGIDAISNASSMTFSSGGFKAKDFKVSNSGMLQLSPGTVECTLATIDNQGMLDANGHIHAASASVSNEGSCAMNTAFSVEGDFTAANNGQMTLGGDVAAKHVKFNNAGLTTYALGIRADKLDMAVMGIETGRMRYTGGDMDINCTGSLTMELDADCGDITSHTDGRLVMTISGKAGTVYNEGAMTQVGFK